ncbi:LysR family transcriptional regulator [Caldinitratiruptor microaerophilus]|uniref:LysR family transcriptional regulator n=1 Tax=Caldinitratiruptor microaerophilus TaxID=671077 RepID=A0AA35CPQ9_9FIRM|nr:LysR family transcriptional regulator [Caldinitratiruptor microaerophilus]BDG61585.1 LysR family transcriptional regulator [Caldinitratiruptor microaerophilus]
MDVQELEAFWWIAQTGSFNRAAERLYLTQPSVTARIQSLEKELGQVLFERRPRGVRLTDAGRALLPHAERVLQAIRKARQAVSDLVSATGGTLAVGSALTTSTYILPEILARYKAAYPGVEIMVRTGRSQQIQQLVLDDTVQLGLVHAPVAPNPELLTVPLYAETIVTVAHPDHPLAGRGEITLEELAGEPFLTPDRSSGYWSVVEQFWASAGLVPHVTMELDSIEAAKRMVMHDLGITMLPRSCVEREIKLGQLAVLRVRDAEKLTRETVLIHRRGKVWSGLVRSFLGVLKDMYGVDIDLGAPAA